MQKDTNEVIETKKKIEFRKKKKIHVKKNIILTELEQGDNVRTEVCRK